MDCHDSDDELRISGSREGVRPLVVAVEGNIRCGKSTFLQYCSSKPGIDVFREPIEKWRDVNGENLLVSTEERRNQSRIKNITALFIVQAKFYENPQKWAMAFQLQVGMTVVDIYETSSMRAIKMIERSLLSSRLVS